MFTTREEAGNLLAVKLIDYSNNKDAVIVAIPRGGVPLGYVIAKKLNLPLEIVLSKKIGHPFHKEFAIGAVTSESIALSEAANGISAEYIEKETERIRDLLKQRHNWYYDNKEPLKLNDKVVIIVDDGVATGNTLISSIKLIQQEQPSQIIVALPVAPPSALKKIKELPSVNDTICLLTPKNFQAVGQFYNDFKQVNDEEVIQLLKEANVNYSNP
ncbi:MAG: phosphoribosyltransferase [Flavobacteriaceae bacterium]|nr:phosphoribosyltransferase [Flavobacteriaceae bacterium]